MRFKTPVLLLRGVSLCALALLAGCQVMRDDAPADAAAEPVAEATEAAPAPAPAPRPSTQPAPAPREPSAVPLAPGAPERYTVVPGDTLWDISKRFLRDPWYWPEIWQVNPQIENPHLIYPGDVISLVYVDGRPQLRLERGESVATTSLPPGVGTERMSPRVRVEPLGQAITTIPYDVIAPFLSRPTVLSREEATRAPHIVALRGDHLVGGRGQAVYARGEDELPYGANYALYHIGEPYRDPDDNDVIGYEAIYVGQGQVVREGDPATLTLTETRREALAGDRLLPLEVDTPLNFYPSAPSVDVEGRIVAVVDGLSRIGQYHIVVLNRGAKDGLAQGHVLEVFQAGKVVKDRFNTVRWPGAGRVELPEEPAGLVMVFRVLDEISYALVTQATNEIRVADTVRNP